MNLLVQSIDRAAGGWLRHRFSRALLASCIVLYLFGMGAILSIKTLVEPEGGGPVPILVQLFIQVPLVILIAIPGAVISVELFVTVIGLLPRRLIAVALLMLSVGVAFLSLVHAIGSIGRIIEESHLKITSLPSLTLIGTLCWWLGTAFAFFVSLELCTQAWWQLTVSDEGFRAASGWRPEASRLFANFRHHMGLPAFLSSFGRGRKMLSLLYFLVAVLNTGVAIVLYMPTLGEMLRAGESGQDLFVILGVLGGLLILSFCGIGHRFARLADGRATHIYQNVREWDSRAPVTFLRAFAQDDIRVAAGTRDPLLKLTAGVADARTLDEILLEHASPYGPVIAIGNPIDPIPPLGAARIFVKGESWHEIVTSLVDASKAIVMCPTRTEGVRWEINLIGGRQLFPLTIFLANPERSASETTKLFAEIADTSIETPARQVPVALFFDPAQGCRVLTATSLTVPTYTVALNVALQALFGAKGVLLVKEVSSDDGKIRVTVPGTWTRLPKLSKLASLQFGNKFKDVYLIVITQTKADLNNLTLEKYHQQICDRMLQKLKNASATESVSVTIDGYPALQDELTGTFKRTKVVFLHTSLDDDDHFQQILAWTRKSRWQKQNQLLREVTASFRSEK